MNAASLRFEVPIECANDNPRVPGAASVQLNEVLPIQGQNNPLLRGSKPQDLFVGYGLPASACILNRQDVVSKSA